MTPLERADRAKQLRADPVLRAAFAETRDGLVAKLEQSAMADKKTHHEIALSLQLLQRIQNLLLRYEEDGKVSEVKRKQDSYIDRLRQSVAQWR